MDDVAADLQAKEDVPEDLAPSVERLSAVLRAVNEDSGTSPQVRDGALVSARQVSDTLDVIADPETPPAVRTQLTRLVKDVTATLEKAGDPRTPPDDRRTLASTSAQTAPGMAFVGRHAAPQGVSRDMTGAMHNAHAAVRQGADRRTAQTVLAATEAAGDPGTSDDDRKGLAESAHETSSSLVDGDPGTPSRKDGLEKKLKEALTARGLSGKPLGKAAEACTDRMFVIVSDTALADDLRDLVPDTWNTTGVEDYWKSTSAHDGSLDVYAQLQDDTPSGTTIATDRLIPELADVLPADDIFTLGIPALDCLQAALRLHDAGVESGNWVRAAQQI
ncbi:hypothetical protein OG739_11545 [Streptomyces longwoodensis]|uniref:hypothetical protein n=1 Tax=Streptomyces longwoodensis TaxID=68231 RepID=UPI0032545004